MRLLNWSRNHPEYHNCGGTTVGEVYDRWVCDLSWLLPSNPVDSNGCTTSDTHIPTEPFMVISDIQLVLQHIHLYD